MKNADVRLRIAVTDTNNEAAARKTGSMLSMILDGTTDEVMARRMRDAIQTNPRLTTRVACTITPSAFRKLTFTAFEIPFRRAKKMPQASDARIMKHSCSHSIDCFPSTCKAKVSRT